MLSTLTYYELALYAAIARHQCMQQVSTEEPRAAIVADDALMDFDKLTEVISRQVLPMRAVIEIIIKLASTGFVKVWNGQRGHAVEPTQLLTTFNPGILITTIHTTSEIIAAFKLDEDRSLDWRRECGAVFPTLVMPDRMRQAVLTPLMPLNYRLSSNSTT